MVGGAYVTECVHPLWSELRSREKLGHLTHLPQLCVCVCVCVCVSVETSLAA